MRLDHPRQPRRRGRVHVQHLRDHGDRAGDGQVLQPQLLAPRAAPATATAAPPADAPHPPRLPGRRPPAAGPRSAPRSAPGPRSPSGVRPAHCRSSMNTTTGRFREATARSTATPARCARTCAVSGSPGSGGTASSAANSGTVAVSRPAFAPVVARIRLADPGQLLLRLGQQQPAQRAERLINRVELQIPAVQVELARHEPAVPARHHRPQLIGQRRLAHPRRPADQHPCTRPATASARPPPPAPPPLPAARQPRRRQQPQRNITLPGPPPGRRAPAGRPAAVPGRQPGHQPSGTGGPGPSPAGA